MRAFTRVGSSIALLALLGGCETKLEGLAQTPAADKGPKVTFDLLARPLPEIPFPNDMATRLDPDSPTGRRVNASLSAPTILENDVRREFNLMDGWGTFAPITVSFDKPIDPVAVRKAHLDDDFANDAVYLVNLKTGEPVALDLGRGNYPVVLQNNDKYFMNDPRENSSNLLFETYEEVDANGNGKLDPEEDTDGDGVWDHPNTIDPSKERHGVAEGRNPPDRSPNGAGGNDIYRDVLSYYERESNTLIIRPVVSLDQRTPYAVVLTRRIKGADGEVIASPFPFVNHAAQTEQLAALTPYLGKGKLAGLQLSDVAFTWAFTTQSVTTDLEEIRRGLYGEGPLKALAQQAPATLEPVTYQYKDTEPPKSGLPVHPLLSDDFAKRINPAKPNPYVLPMKQFEPALRTLAPQIGAEPGPLLDYLIDGYKFVDYFVIGSFRSPDFLDDPEKPSFDAVFRVNAQAGLARVWQRPTDWAQAEADALEAELTKAPNDPEIALLQQKARDVTRDRVWFFLAVPKAQYLKDGKITLEKSDGATLAHGAPFPVSIYGHGYTSERTEHLGFAGNLAKFGIASVCIDSYGHGLGISTLERSAITGVLGADFEPMSRAIFKNRARDLDHDGTQNSGGDFWVADTFHTRDVVRQTVVDWMQLVRVFRGFGTYEMGDIDGDGKAELAGDFNADGVPDVSGPEYPTQSWWTQAGKRNPGSDFFAWGQSLGGFISGIAPAVEPAIAAAAPVAGGAGLPDVAIRSEQGGVIQAVFLEMFGPIIGGEPDGNGVRLTFDVQDVNHETRLALTEEPLDIRPGDRLVVHNLNSDDDQNKDDSIVVPQSRVFRLHVVGDNASFYDDAPVDDEAHAWGKCQLEKLAPADAKAEMDKLRMIHPADCIQIRVYRGAGAEPVQVIDTFPKAIGFQKRQFPKGSPLVMLSRGFGMKRGTKTFRRFMSLAQTILEPADPANYTQHYFKDLLAARKGNPAAVLVVGTTGDLNVPVNTAYSMGRIAGVLPYAYDPEKHAAWGMSPNDVLIQSHATEAIEKLGYFEPLAKALVDGPPLPQLEVGAGGKTLADLVDCGGALANCNRYVLADPGLYSYDPEKKEFLDSTNSPVRCTGQGDDRLDAGRCDGTNGVPRFKHSLRDATVAKYEGLDETGAKATRTSAMITPYINAVGKHGFDMPHPDEAFDVELYMINMLGHFFQTRGQDLRFDVCMHNDGWKKLRTEKEGNERVPACDFIPDYPKSF